MAYMRSRKRKGGTFWYVVDSTPVTGRDGKTRHVKTSRAAGEGREGREFAQEWVMALQRARRRQKAGLAPEQTACRWTLGTLRDRDLEDARSRGLASLARRSSHWENLIAVLGADTNLDRITPAVVGPTGSYARERMRASGRARPVGPAAVNRDLRSVLAPALKLARQLRDESGYSGRPFEDVPQLEERSKRRRPRALTPAEALRLLTAAWTEAHVGPRPWRPFWRQNAAIVELLLLTGSRRSQILGLRKDQVRGRSLIFPAQKGGQERTFVLTARVRDVLAQAGRSSGPFVFEGRAGGPRVEFRRFWLAATKRARLPGLKPHDLRHTAAHEALRRGRAIGAAQGLLGHSTPATTQKTYLQLRPRRLMPLSFGGPGVPRATLRNSGAGRKPRQPRA